MSQTVRGVPFAQRITGSLALRGARCTSRTCLSADGCEVLPQPEATAFPERKRRWRYYENRITSRHHVNKMSLKTYESIPFFSKPLSPGLGLPTVRRRGAAPKHWRRQPAGRAAAALQPLPLRRAVDGAEHQRPARSGNGRPLHGPATSSPEREPETPWQSQPRAGRGPALPAAAEGGSRRSRNAHSGGPKARHYVR